MKYLKITPREFELMREEIKSSYSQTGCMDGEAVNVAIEAYKAMKKVEKRNNIPSIWED